VPNLPYSTISRNSRGYFARYAIRDASGEWVDHPLDGRHIIEGSTAATLEGFTRWLLTRSEVSGIAFNIYRRGYSYCGPCRTVVS
jgi:hypothetical protein